MSLEQNRIDFLKYIEEIEPTLVLAHGKHAPHYLQLAVLVIDCITAGRAITEIGEENPAHAMSLMPKMLVNLLERAFSEADAIAGATLDKPEEFGRFVSNTVLRQLRSFVPD